ncbi:MAG: threonine/serine exporter family protein [Gordonia sp. (in: high G+C Gram-positive bacteria)]|uniref:threonine/serine ThrE exporter family protein n=1 Tax=Gordonia TaxID=2053 RepID=UPI003267FA15
MPPAGHTDESEMLALVTEVGTALNRSSYPVPRITQVLQHICASHRSDIVTQVFANYLIVLDKDANRIQIENTGSMDRFDQIADAEALVHEVRHRRIPVRRAIDGLRAVAASPPPVSPILRSLGYALMALGFAPFFQMSLPATIAAVVVSIPLSAIVLWGSTKTTLVALMPVLLTFLSALAITLWAVHGDLAAPVRLAVIPVVTLIPGASLATAVIELSAGDMITGTARLAYALMILLSMAFGLAVAIDLVGLSAADLQDVTTALAPSWVLWLAGPVFGIGAMLYFCMSKRLCLWVLALTIGTFWLNHFLGKVMLPAFAGGIAVGVALLVAWVINAHAPGRPSVFAMFLPAFWLMVPGSMGFVAISGAITADHQLGSLGTGAALSLLSMATSMMIASGLAPFVTRKPPPVRLPTPVFLLRHRRGR